MDCPNCGVFNPEERENCWRCNTELPKQAPPKRRSSQQSARMWLYVALAFFAIMTFARMCGAGPAWLQPDLGVPPEGMLPGRAPVVYQLDMAVTLDLL
jgi:hypothetical protein